MSNNLKGHLWIDWSDTWDYRDSKGCILTKNGVLHHNSKYQRIHEKSCCVLNMKWSHLQSLPFSLYKGHQMRSSTITCKAPQESTAAQLFGLSRCLSSSFGKVKANRSRRPIQNQDVMQLMEGMYNGGWGRCLFQSFHIQLKKPTFVRTEMSGFKAHYISHVL